MKATGKQRRFWKIVLPAVVLAVICLVGYSVSHPQSLSESEIAKLRQKYPVCGDIRKIQNAGSYRIPTWDQIQEVNDTFIYCTIEGDMTTYDAYISTGNSELDKKRQENGIGDVYKFYEYPITVIEDAAGIFQPGDKLTIAANMAFVDFNPHLSKGMKVIAPVILDMDKDTRTQFGVQGFYYVTEDGYALSAFDEQKASMKTPVTGKKADVLLRELKQAMKE